MGENHEEKITSYFQRVSPATPFANGSLTYDRKCRASGADINL